MPSSCAAAAAIWSRPPAPFTCVATLCRRISLRFAVLCCRFRKSSLDSSPASIKPTILSTSLSLPPNSCLTRASGLVVAMFRVLLRRGGYLPQKGAKGNRNRGDRDGLGVGKSWHGALAGQGEQGLQAVHAVAGLGRRQADAHLAGDVGGLGGDPVQVGAAAHQQDLG